MAKLMTNTDKEYSGKASFFGTIPETITDSWKRYKGKLTEPRNRMIPEQKKRFTKNSSAVKSRNNKGINESRHR